MNAADKSADAATKLAETAEVNAQKELRAYLDFDNVRLERWTEIDGKGPTDPRGMRLSITIQNYGRTPAQNVESVFRSTARIAHSDEIVNLGEDDRKDLHSIAPGDHFNLRYHWFAMPDLLIEIEDQKLFYRAHVVVTYTDVFGGTQVLRAGFEGRGANCALTLVEGMRSAT